MKKFFANFFITGISWLIYNTFFFLIYLLFLAMRWDNSGSGAVVDSSSFYSYVITLAVFSVLLIASFIAFFFIGKKVLLKCKNPVLTFLSCFSSYAVIAFVILRSDTLLAFTRPYLDVLFSVIIFAKQNLVPPVINEEYLIWHSEIVNKQLIVMDLSTSGLNNALFALLPFIIAYIGLCIRKKKIKTEIQYDDPEKSGDGVAID